MAYQATGNYNDAALSESDKALVEQYKQQYATAQAAGDKAGMDAAHAGAESIRANYNYSGGTDGSNYSRLNTSAYDLSDYLKEQSRANIEADLANLKNAYNNNVTAYDRQLSLLPQNYEVARNSAAAQNAIAQKNFNEQANAMGLNSGTSGQAALARSSVYQGELADINKEEASKRNDINFAKTQLQSEYENAIAQAKATGDSALANALYQEMVRTQNMEREDEQIAKQYALQNESLQRQLAQNKAETLAAYGNFSGYSALGYTPEEISSMNNAYQAALATPTTKSSSSGGGGRSGKSSSSSSKTTPTSSLFADALEYSKKYGADAGENYIRQYYKDYGYSSVSPALAGFNNYLVEQTAKQEENKYASAGMMTRAEFTRHKNSSSYNDAKLFPTYEDYVYAYRSAHGI